MMSDYCQTSVTTGLIHVTALNIDIYILSHLQRLIDIGGQDWQKVIYATDQESP